MTGCRWLCYCPYSLLRCLLATETEAKTRRRTTENGEWRMEHRQRVREIWLVLSAQMRRRGCRQRNICSNLTLELSSSTFFALLLLLNLLLFWPVWRLDGIIKSYAKSWVCTLIYYLLKVLALYSLICRVSALLGSVLMWCVYLRFPSAVPHVTSC